MGDLSWITARPVAHRGLHDAARGVIENSLSAAEAAAVAGYPIELDLQLSADGEAVVFHDFTLDRLTQAKGAVSARPATELARIGLAGTSDTIPTLGAFLARVAGRVPLFIEMKSAFSGDTRLAARAVEVLAGYDGGPVALISFDPEMLAQAKARAPQIARGIIAQATYSGAHWPGITPQRARMLADMDHLALSGYDFISYRFTDLTRPAVASARARGVPVTAWTVRSPQDADRALAGADQIVFEEFTPEGQAG